MMEAYVGAGRAADLHHQNYNTGSGKHGSIMVANNTTFYERGAAGVALVAEALALADLSKMRVG